MEIKETNHLITSAEINVVKPSEKNSSDKRSIYEMIFSAEKDETDNIINSRHADIINEERKFSDVSTLDWLHTWRPTEIS